MTVNEDLGFP